MNKKNKNQAGRLSWMLGLTSKRAEGYVDTAVKVLIAVVIGALLLFGLYSVVDNIVIPTTTSKVTSMFNTPVGAFGAGSGSPVSPVNEDPVLTTQMYIPFRGVSGRMQACAEVEFLAQSQTATGEKILLTEAQAKLAQNPNARLWLQIEKPAGVTGIYFSFIKEDESQINVDLGKVRSEGLYDFDCGTFKWYQIGGSASFTIKNAALFIPVEDDTNAPPLQTPGATFIGYCSEYDPEFEQGVPESFVCEPKTLTWEELKAGVDADKYGYDPSVITDTEVGEWAFYMCSTLASINIPVGVISIEDDAFSGCRQLTHVSLPNGLESIGVEAFYYCLSLRPVVLPSSLRIIKDMAFNLLANDFCKDFTYIEIPNGVEIIGKNAFVSTPLKSITIPGSVKSLGGNMFGYGDLVSIVVEEGVTSIPNEFATNNNHLVTVELPSTITSIERNAFSSCEALTDIHYNGTKAQWNAIAKTKGWDDKSNNYTVHCTDGDISK